MINSHGTGVILIVAGVGLTLLGLLVWSGVLGFLGHLPGDIYFEGKDTKIYLPLASCLLVSVVLSLLRILAGKFL